MSNEELGRVGEAGEIRMGTWLIKSCKLSRAILRWLESSAALRCAPVRRQSTQKRLFALVLADKPGQADREQGANHQNQKS